MIAPFVGVWGSGRRFFVGLSNPGKGPGGSGQMHVSLWLRGADGGGFIGTLTQVAAASVALTSCRESRSAFRLGARKRTVVRGHGLLRRVLRAPVELDERVADVVLVLEREGIERAADELGLGTGLAATTRPAPTRVLPASAAYASPSPRAAAAAAAAVAAAASAVSTTSCPSTKQRAASAARATTSSNVNASSIGALR